MKGLRDSNNRIIGPPFGRNQYDYIKNILKLLIWQGWVFLINVYRYRTVHSELYSRQNKNAILIISLKYYVQSPR